jgi:hypothetical protein
MADDKPKPGEDIVEWGVRTGRFRAERAGFWRSQMAHEKRVLAASGTKITGPTPVERAIESLFPVFAEPAQPSGIWVTSPNGNPTPRINASGTPAYATSDTPLLDELDRAMFGPTPEQRRREEDLAVEQSLREALEAERATADSNQLSDEEMRAIFPQSTEE